MKKELTPRQIQAIEQIMALPTLEAAAESIGTSRRQLSRWLIEPEFSAALQRAQHQLIAATVRKLAQGMDEAAITVLKLSRSSENERVRLRAVSLVVSLFKRLSADDDFDARLSALEFDRRPTANLTLEPEPEPEIKLETTGSIENEIQKTTPA